MQRILVALDGSPRAPAVLSVAIALARKMGGTLYLMRAVGIPAGLPSDVWKQSEESLPDVLRHSAASYLEGVAKNVPQELLAGLRAVVGSPWSAICAQAQEDAVDVIIIGAHGYGAIDRLLGTTAAKVVNHADRSVLVVRGQAVAKD
jgi:nucleotide-binding universal stress UspA family protein